MKCYRRVLVKLLKMYPKEKLSLEQDVLKKPGLKWNDLINIRITFPGFGVGIIMSVLALLLSGTPLETSPIFIHFYLPLDMCMVLIDIWTVKPKIIPNYLRCPLFYL